MPCPIADTIKSKLLKEAESVKPKPTPPSGMAIALELYKVIGELYYEKSMSRKKVMAWLKKRGYEVKYHHVKAALKKYDEPSSAIDKSERTRASRPDADTHQPSRPAGSRFARLHG